MRADTVGTKEQIVPERLLRAAALLLTFSISACDYF